jgi:hypothetical protein
VIDLGWLGQVAKMVSDLLGLKTANDTQKKTDERKAIDAAKSGTPPPPEQKEK